MNISNFLEQCDDVLDERTRADCKNTIERAENGIFADINLEKNSDFLLVQSDCATFIIVRQFLLMTIFLCARVEKLSSARTAKR